MPQMYADNMDENQCCGYPASDQATPPYTQLAHSVTDQVPKNSPPVLKKKEATDGIRGYSPGNRNVSRTAFRQEVVSQFTHTGIGFASANLILFRTPLAGTHL